MGRSIKERVALVTGGSRGIGRAIAGRLAAEGAEVVIAARGLDAAEAAAAEIRESGGAARAISMDVSDDSSVAGGVAELLEAYARIPLLVNNAGITRDNLLVRMKGDEWNSVIETNLTSVYRMCKALVPSMMRARYGRIVNVTSVVAGSGNPGQVNYAAAKAGIEGFTRSLAREVATRGITVNSVAPGFIETDMTRELNDQQRQALRDQIPMKRLGTPEDVAAPVSFLLSEEAGYISGTTLYVNGGMYM